MIIILGEITNGEGKMKQKIYEFVNWPALTILDYLFSFKKKIFLKKKNDFILISSFPKSACNYLAYLLSELLQYKRDKINITGGYFHDTIYLPRLIDIMLRKRVITNHLRLTLLSRPIINELKISPIVLVRNINDVIVSYNDHIKRDGIGPLDADKHDLSPEFCKNFFDFSQEKQFDYIIDTIVPWYISYYVSWYHYTKITQEVNAYWLRFEDLTADPKKYLNEIFDFYNFSVPETDIDSLVKQDVKVNYNKGVSGRGDLLTQKQKDKIKMLASYHENIDFSMMGL